MAFAIVTFINSVSLESFPRQNRTMKWIPCSVLSDRNLILPIFVTNSQITGPFRRTLIFSIHSGIIFTAYRYCGQQECNVEGVILWVDLL